MDGIGIVGTSSKIFVTLDPMILSNELTRQNPGINNYNLRFCLQIFECFSSAFTKSMKNKRVLAERARRMTVYDQLRHHISRRDFIARDTRSRDDYQIMARRA
jgi:hypothetical protein